jgi:hypothetical protein
MHNGLIFPYHRVRARPNFGLLRGWPFGAEPTHPEAGSDGGTQEGRSSRALVVPG